MTIYIPAAATVSGFSAQTLDVVELRVISNLLQREAANSAQDELSRLRNDQAFELGIVPPVVPGN